jgi:hypothetical protein
MRSRKDVLDGLTQRPAIDVVWRTKDRVWARDGKNGKNGKNFFGKK